MSEPRYSHTLPLQRRPIRHFALVLALGVLCWLRHNCVVQSLPNRPTPDPPTTTGAEADDRSAAGPKAQATRANPLAGCVMCHTDVEVEFVGTGHFNKNIGCVTCHGPSAGHLADENNEVKPDQQFAREDVDRLCGVCHICPRPKEAQKPKSAPGKVCTDCHGRHNLALLNEEGHTPLHEAARKGQTKIVELLIKKGANVNAKTKRGRTPLQWAAKKGHTEIAELLIQKGADVKAKDEEGGTPLRMAAANGHTGVAKLLIQKGAAVNARDKSGRTPLSYGRGEIADLLRKHGGRQ